MTLKYQAASYPAAPLALGSRRPRPVSRFQLLYNERTQLKLHTALLLTCSWGSLSHVAVSPWCVQGGSCKMNSLFLVLCFHFSHDCRSAEMEGDTWSFDHALPWKPRALCPPAPKYLWRKRDLKFNPFNASRLKSYAIFGRITSGKPWLARDNGETTGDADPSSVPVLSCSDSQAQPPSHCLSGSNQLSGLWGLCGIRMFAGVLFLAPSHLVMWPSWADSLRASPAGLGTSRDFSSLRSPFAGQSVFHW